jgi:hypothetical protein
VAQPAILSNGTLASRVTQLSDGSAWTRLALADLAIDELIDRIYLRLLSRKPRPVERALFAQLLAPGYDQRRIPSSAPEVSHRSRLDWLVSWSNHLDPEATRIQQELDAEVRAGDLPTARLVADWRQRLEDMIWAIVNSPEFVFLP